MNITLIVEVLVKPEHIENFIKETLFAKSGAESESGCLVYNILQDSQETNKFKLIEIYKDQDAFEEHKKAPHFLAWRNNIQEMMASPREARRYKLLT